MVIHSYSWLILEWGTRHMVIMLLHLIDWFCTLEFYHRPPSLFVWCRLDIDKILLSIGWSPNLSYYVFIYFICFPVSKQKLGALYSFCQFLHAPQMTKVLGIEPNSETEQGATHVQFFQSRLHPEYYRRKFRSQTSDNMDRWKSRGGKSQRREKKRQDQRRERVRRKKMQVREKVEKSRLTVFCQTRSWRHAMQKQAQHGATWDLLAAASHQVGPNVDTIWATLRNTKLHRCSKHVGHQNIWVFRRISQRRSCSQTGPSWAWVGAMLAKTDVHVADISVVQHARHCARVRSTSWWRSADSVLILSRKSCKEILPRRCF